MIARRVERGRHRSICPPGSLGGGHTSSCTVFVMTSPNEHTPVREGETIEGSRTMRNRPLSQRASSQQCNSATRGETPRGEREPRKLPRTTLGTGQYIVHRNVRQSSWPERERPPSLTHHRRPLLRWWGSATPTGLPYTLQSYMRPPDANLPPSGRQFTLSTSGRPPSALQLHESGLPARVPALQTP